MIATPFSLSRRICPNRSSTSLSVIAAVGSWFICRPKDMFTKFAVAPNLLWLIVFCFLTALITAVIPFLLYTLGLHMVEAGKAGILATVEPMVATIIGIVFFSEQLTIFSGLGILLILVAVIILNLKKKDTK